MRGPDSWTGPNGLTARFGRDAAHGEGFYGFRLAARTDLGSRVVRAWAIVPAAVNERDLVPGLIEGADGLAGLLADKGFNGKKFTESHATQRISILTPHNAPERAFQYRVASGVAACGWLTVAAVLVSPRISATGRRRLATGLVVVSVLAVVANGASRSAPERAVWTPYALVMLGCAALLRRELRAPATTAKGSSGRRAGASP